MGGDSYGVCSITFEANLAIQLILGQSGNTSSMGSGSDTYGSGMSSGAGYGNKTSSELDSSSGGLPSDYGNDNRLGESGGYGGSTGGSGSDRPLDAYSGSTGYGSGTTGGFLLSHHHTRLQRRYILIPKDIF